MKETLIELLETFGYPVSLQGSYEEGAELPESFFTFWNDATDVMFYSNGVSKEISTYRIFFYSIDPSLTNTVLRQAITLLRNNNFYCGGDNDIDSGEPKYTAREVEVSYINI